MKLASRLRKLTPREAVLLGAAAYAAVGFALLHFVVVPTFREWRVTGQRVEDQARELGRLERNLAYRQSADAEFKRLPPQAFEVESEQLTLASWLRDLEAGARKPGVALNSTKPLPVQRERGYSTYSVRVSLSGRLADVLRFVSDAVDGPSAVGIQSCTMRAVQGPNNVECALTLRMVRVKPPGAKPGGGGKQERTGARAA